MAYNKLFFLIERLDFTQWTAAMETGFGRFLFLFQNFDPTSNKLKLSDNRILEITEKDVHTTLILLMGPLEVRLASAFEPKNEYTKHLEQWCTRWNLSRTGAPKEDGRTNSTQRRPWIRIQKRLCELSLEERDAKTDGFPQQYIGQLMQLNNVIKMKRSSLESMEGGKTIDRIDYELISHEGETDLQEECGIEREPPMAGLNDPIEDEHFFNDPKFFDAYLKMEAVALKHYQHRTLIDYIPPTFDLGIPFSPEQRTPTAISSSIKGTPTISSSPAYNDKRVCLGESKGQHTSMHAIADIALQYSESAHHITRQEKDHSSQQVEDELLRKLEGNVK
ncbi:LOW QUALITY PROTEIN: hypothetical protein Cgig2_011153 [Carnegiea gigantea]|uniref:Uncharacterized protein n=1 Tax=Carnegiea gigantea TaxID=171969 RepID=A0A9Q1GK78_9CARY|nr:LOW QUALITY PROTEIN: hypothetical protein Cgig2_011153 [Carnegiea gigantea]